MPFLSMVRSACAETFSFTQRFSLATQKRRSCRLGRKRRRVLLLACETLLPVCTPLPVTWHTRDIRTSMVLGVAHSLGDGGPGDRRVATRSGEDLAERSGRNRVSGPVRARGRTQRAAHYARRGAVGQAVIHKG